MELVDGGDVGEDEPDHILGEGLAASGLLQQLLEEHLPPPLGYWACSREGATHASPGEDKHGLQGLRGPSQPTEGFHLLDIPLSSQEPQKR